MTPRARNAAWIAGGALALAGGTGCGTTGPDVVEAQCAAQIEWHGAMWTGYGAGNKPVPSGRRLGTGVRPACNDTPGVGTEEKDQRVALYAVRGLPEKLGVVTGPASRALYIAPRTSLTPAERRRLNRFIRRLRSRDR
jgi:hypothetical protein